MKIRNTEIWTETVNIYKSSYSNSAEIYAIHENQYEFCSDSELNYTEVMEIENKFVGIKLVNDIETSHTTYHKVIVTLNGTEFISKISNKNLIAIVSKYGNITDVEFTFINNPSTEVINIDNPIVKKKQKFTETFFNNFDGEKKLAELEKNTVYFSNIKNPEKSLNIFLGKMYYPQIVIKNNIPEIVLKYKLAKCSITNREFKLDTIGVYPAMMDIDSNRTIFPLKTLEFDKEIKYIFEGTYRQNNKKAELWEIQLEKQLIAYYNYINQKEEEANDYYKKQGIDKTYSIQDLTPKSVDEAIKIINKVLANRNSIIHYSAYEVEDYSIVPKFLNDAILTEVSIIELATKFNNLLQYRLI